MPPVTGGTLAGDANHPTRPPVPAQWGSVPCFWELTAWGEHSQGQQSCYKFTFVLHGHKCFSLLQTIERVCSMFTGKLFGNASTHPRGLKRDIQE